jgi:hypoxanthine-DNA glycosylase
VVDEHSRVLILGTFSGWNSAQRNEYYACSGNVFWRILGSILGFPSGAPYAHRVAHLLKSGIALWNVCVGPSLVTSVNDFTGFFGLHPGIDLILFNGTQARGIYNHRVLPYLTFRWHGVSFEVLPSTSPLYSAMSFDEKLARWRAAFDRGQVAWRLPISKL